MTMWVPGGSVTGETNAAGAYDQGDPHDRANGVRVNPILRIGPAVQ